MGVIITIDQGNSSVKYSVFDAENKLLRSTVSPVPDLDVLPELLQHENPDGAIFASVAGIDARFVESLRRLTDENLLVLTPSTPIPLTNNYRSAATLGADRIAAAVGATAIMPGEAVIIADAGSALTCDLVSPEAAYCGGSISPGIAMRLYALSQFTSRLPKVAWSNSDTISRFPLTTADALVSGAVLGVADQIRGAFLDARAKYPTCRLVVTGGDAKSLCEAGILNDLNPTCCPSLVAVGLNCIFRYNETYH